MTDYGKSILEKYPGVRISKKATIDKYGLSEDEWLEMLDRQGGVCAICKKLPTTGRLVVDHMHVSKWKHMVPTCRKVWVRGLLCHFDNHYTLARSVTVVKAKRLVEYLENFDKKIQEYEAKSMPASVLEGKKE
jgi:hypothetical protein